MAAINGYLPQPTALMFETDEGKRMASGRQVYWRQRFFAMIPPSELQTSQSRHRVQALGGA
ncbi:hypothetical protein OKW43_005768 [Paraburkholderia sp. WC7.3g]